MRRRGFWAGQGRVGSAEELLPGAQLAWQHTIGVGVAGHYHPGIAHIANAGDDLVKLFGTVPDFELPTRKEPWSKDEP